jgi:hypothetical protein
MGLTRAQRYGTHLPVLIKAVLATKGPVLELGCGLASTPMLFWICQEQGRKFVSYENDSAWIRRVGYPVNLSDDWNQIDIDNTHWSVAFLDHRPGERRIIDAIRLEDKADLIILHDSEPELDKYYQYQKIYPMFKYRLDYTKFLPNTVVLSNLVDIEKYLK